MIKNILIVGAAGFGAYLLINAARGSVTTTGEPVKLSNKGGFIVDEKGRVWV